MISSAPIKTVLVGLGRMGGLHFQKLQKHPLFNLVALVDPKPTPEIEPALPLFTSLDDLDAASIDYDVAVVATPTHTHFDVAKHFLANNKSLLLEKPLTTYSSDARILETLARQHKCYIGVGHIERHNPAINSLDKILKSGWLGAALDFRFTRIGAAPKIKQAQNNVIIDLAVHDFDILNYLCEERTFLVKSSLGHFSDKVIYVAQIALQNKSRQSAAVNVSWMSPIKRRTLRVQCEKGLCDVNLINQSLTIYPSLSASPIPSDILHHKINPYGIAIEIEKIDALMAQYAEFHKALKAENSFMCNIDSGAKAVELAESAIGLTNE